MSRDAPSVNPQTARKGAEGREPFQLMLIVRLREKLPRYERDHGQNPGSDARESVRSCVIFFDLFPIYRAVAGLWQVLNKKDMFGFFIPGDL